MISHAPTTTPRFGAFGEYGGRFVTELLFPALDELRDAQRDIVPTDDFQSRFRAELSTWAGRPTPLTHLPRFSEESGLRITAKREDLLHGGAHKTNNVIGQALLAQALGKRRLIAETGAGQHGVATAMVAARLGLEAVVYMGARDVERQAPNVERMRLCGARVVPVEQGSATLKDAINEAMRDWVENRADTHYLLGTVCGPDPFPSLVRDFHRVIGDEAREQQLQETGRLPDACVACVGGGSNAIGLFAAFLDDPEVQLIGVEAEGLGKDTKRHAATLQRGRPGLLHGARSYVLQDEDGQVQSTHSVAAGLDYPGVGPQHAELRDSGRAQYFGVDDTLAVDGFEACSRLEGILPALETSHALGFLLRAVERRALREGAHVVVNLSGRGDKDLGNYMQHCRATRGGAR